MAPAGLKDVESRVDAVPHPITAQPIHILGGNSLEVTLAGIWKRIYPGMPYQRANTIRMKSAYVGDEERGVCPVKKVARRISSKDVLRKPLQPSVAQIRPVQD